MVLNVRRVISLACRTLSHVNVVRSSMIVREESLHPYDPYVEMHEVQLFAFD